MGALPDRLPGFQHVENDELRAKFDDALGRDRPAEARLAPVGHVRRDGARRAPGALRHRREPGPVGGRPEAGEAPPLDPRLPGRPGHLPDRDRRARRRRPAGRRVVGRERGHRHELRAARPAGPQGARAAGRGARRPLDHRGARPPDGRRLGLADRRGRLERGPDAVAGPRRDVLPAARGARRAPVAVLRREPPRRAVPPQPALGGPGAGQPRPVRRRSTTIRRSTSSTDDYPIRLTTGRRLDSYNTGVQTGGYTSPLRRGESLDISPEDAEALRAAPTASASGSSRVAARSRRRSGSTSRCGPG